VALITDLQAVRARAYARSFVACGLCAAQTHAALLEVGEEPHPDVARDPPLFQEGAAVKVVVIVREHVVELVQVAQLLGLGVHQ